MPDTDWAFKSWWELGGHLWLESYVDRAMRTLYIDEQTVSQRWVVVPPSFRNTLSFETEPEHAIAWLLCSQNDPDCGVAAAGWRHVLSGRSLSEPDVGWVLEDKAKDYADKLVEIAARSFFEGQPPLPVPEFVLQEIEQWQAEYFHENVSPHFISAIRRSAER